MPVTPQAIKDQEFQSKFRGYDTIEVKAYLELLAEEFFELLEEGRKHQEDQEILEQEKQALAVQNEHYEREIEAMRQEQSRLRLDIGERNEKIEALKLELEELQTAMADFEQERREFEEELSEKEDKYQEAVSRIQEVERTNDTLTSKVSLLSEQVGDLKKEEVEFKSTLGHAQKFAREVRDHAEAEARTMLKRAESDVSRFREESSKELARIPREIEDLHEKRRQVRNELKDTLQTYLIALDAFSEVEECEQSEEIHALYQKISIGEDSPVDLGKADELDDLEQIEMNLDLPTSLLDNEEKERI